MFTTIRRTAYVRAATSVAVATIAVGAAAAPANAQDFVFKSCPRVQRGRHH